MAAPVRTQPSLSVGTPVPLFEMKRPWLGFEPSSNGRVLAIVQELTATEQPQTVVLNWTAELAKPKGDREAGLTFLRRLTAKRLR